MVVPGGQERTEAEYAAVSAELAERQGFDPRYRGPE